jgi:prophage regulatory protein
MLFTRDDASFRAGGNMRVLGYADLRQKGIRFSRQWIGVLVDRGEFPPPINLGEQSVAFIESEIDEWLACRIRERDEKLVRNRATSEIEPISGSRRTKSEKLRRPPPLGPRSRRSEISVAGDSASEDATGRRQVEPVSEPKRDDPPSIFKSPPRSPSLPRLPTAIRGPACSLLVEKDDAAIANQKRPVRRVLTKVSHNGSAARARKGSGKASKVRRPTEDWPQRLPGAVTR